MQPNDWELWLDAQISPIIAKWMSDYTGLIVKSSYALQTIGMDDIDIYVKAHSAGKIIIVSKDVDFAELINRLGSPPKLISLKIGNCDNRVLWERIKPKIHQMVELLTSTEIDIIELE